MAQNVHEKVQQAQAAVSAVNERIRRNLGALDQKYTDISDKLRALREISKTSGQDDLNKAADFFGNRLETIADSLRSASLAQLKIHKTRLQNLHGLAADSMRGTPQMRGFSEQYEMVLKKVDDEISSRKRLTGTLSNFLKKNSIDAVSITTALTTRNPLIGLGVKYFLERRQAMKELEQKQKSFLTKDNVEFARLERERLARLQRAEEAARKKAERDANKASSNDKDAPFKNARKHKVPKTGTVDDGIIDAEWWQSSTPNRNTGPRMVGAPGAPPPQEEEKKKPRQGRPEPSYNYTTILSWAKAQKKVTSSLIQRTFKVTHDVAVKILQRLKADGVPVWEPPKQRVMDMVQYNGEWRPAGWFQRESVDSDISEEDRIEQMKRERGIGVPRLLMPAAPGAKPRDAKGRFARVRGQQALVPYRGGPEDQVLRVLTDIKTGISAIKKQGEENKDLAEEKQLEDEKRQEQFIDALEGRNNPTASMVPARRGGGGALQTIFSTFVGNRVAGLLPSAGGAAATTAGGATGRFGVARIMSAFGAGGGAAQAAGAAGGGAAGGAGRGIGFLAGRLGGSLLALAIDAVLGWFKSCEWGVSKSSATIGGMLGGTFKNTMLNTFSQMGKWALIGATVGSAVPGIGTLAGGIVGAAMGGILGFIGGERIAKFMESTGLGHMIGSFFKMIGSAVIFPFKRLWSGLKTLGLGVKVVWRMLGFMYDVFIGPLTKIYDKTIGPILQPGLDGFKKLFHLLGSIFDWITKVINHDAGYEKMVDQLLSDDNLFDQVLGSFQRAFLDFAAGLLEKVPSWIPGSGFLHQTAKDFRKKSEEIANKTRTQKPPIPQETESSQPPAPVSQAQSTTSGEEIPIPPKIRNSRIASKGGLSGVTVGTKTTPKEVNGDVPPMLLAPVGKALTPSNIPNDGQSSGTTSKAGLDMIKKFEGRPKRVYWDHKGYSAGYGHLLTPEEYERFKDKEITQQQADAWLAQDIKRFEKAVNSKIKVPLTQDMFDSLVSFTYNTGEGSLTNIAETLNRGDYEGAAKRMQRYVLSSGKVNAGLVSRRKQETGKFLASMPKPTQGQAIMAMQRENEDGRAQLAARGPQSAPNVVVSAPKTTVSNTAVLSPQSDPRNRDSTFRDVRNRNF